MKRPAARALHLLALIFLLLVTSRIGLAQALPTATGPGSLLVIGGEVSAFQADYGRRILGGAGGFLDANINPHLGVEIEGRRLWHNQEAGVTETVVLGGFRVRKETNFWEAYAKVLAGQGSFTFPYGYAQGSYFVMAGGAGLDLHLGDHWRIRAADLEYHVWPNFTYGNLQPYGLSSGIAYRFF